MSGAMRRATVSTVRVSQGLVDQFALWVAPVARGKGLQLFCEPAHANASEADELEGLFGGAVAQIYQTA
jgi:hypothetical protein